MSNLLEKASIVTTPTAYENGKILSVKPAPSLGIEQIENGDFATDSNWTKGAGWTISGGTANATSAASGTPLSQYIDTGKKYKITYDVVSLSQGAFQVDLSFSGTALGQLVTTTGTFTDIVTSINPALSIRVVGTTTGSIDNVSVKELIDGDFDFTRNSSATRVNSQGLIEDMQILSGDLVSNGDFSNGANNWTLGASWSIGNNKATRLTNVDWGLDQTISSAVTGRTYRVTTEITDYTSGELRLALGSGGTVNVIGNALGVYVNEFVWTGSSGSIIRFQGSFVGSISNITILEITDDTNLPRIDYTGGVGHWLFEPQSTNLIITSDSGVYGNNPASEILTTAPDGTNTAVRPVPDSNSDRYTGQISGGTYATNTKITYSWYRKRISTPVNVSFVGDLRPSVLVNVTQVGSTIQVKSDVNGFDRFSATFNITDGSLAVNIRLYFGDIIGTGNSSVAYWGHQLEVGSFATSIIPTSGSTVTRLKDAAFGAGNSSLINSTEGVLYAEIAALANDGTFRLLSLSDGTSSNRVYLGYNNNDNTITANVTSGGVSQGIISYTTTDLSLFHKVAVKYKNNNVSLYVNGIEVGAFPSATTPSGLNALQFTSGSISSVFFGKTKCVAVFKEALSNDELECLTGEGYDSFNALALANNYTII